MEYARHPEHRRFINAAQHRADYGHSGPPARCPVCATPMFIRTKMREGLAFAHYRDSGCPTLEPAGKPYIGLTPQHPDLAAARAIKQAFSQTWRRHYKRVMDMVPLLAPDEFTNLLDLATKRRTWAYEGLELRDIPYILVLQADFTPWAGRKEKLTWKPRRKFWFRFWLETTNTDVSALWANGRRGINLVRGTYRPPRSETAKPPGLESLVRQPKDFDTTGDFLQGPEPEIDPYDAGKVENWFSRHPTFLADI